MSGGPLSTLQAPLLARYNAQQPHVPEALGLVDREHVDDVVLLAVAGHDLLAGLDEHGVVGFAELATVEHIQPIPVHAPLAETGEATPLTASLHPVSRAVQPLVLADRSGRCAALLPLEVHRKNGMPGVYGAIARLRDPAVASARTA